MRIYQEGQSKNRIVSFLIDVIIVLFILPGPILNSVLFITGRDSRSGQLAIVYVVIAVVTVVTAVISAKRMAPTQICTTFALLAVVFIGFLLTKWKWGTTKNALFDSELRLYIASAPTVFLISLVIGWKKKTDINIKLLFVIDVFITIICAIVVVTNRTYTAAGYIFNSSGFLYQNISYYCAECLGITLFIMDERKRQKEALKKNGLLIILSALQFLTCFVAGGRGGMVLSFVLTCFCILRNGVKKTLFKYAIPLIIIFILIFNFIPAILTDLDVNIQGMSRILSLFGNNDIDADRFALWRNSIQAYNNHFLLGNGIGSVFYLFNSYSHNVFVDVLCETGTVGAIVFVLILCDYFLKARKVSKISQLYRLFEIVFICGFTLNLFSGYIWVNNLILLPVAATFTNHKLIIEESLTKSATL